MRWVNGWHRPFAGTVRFWIVHVIKKRNRKMCRATIRGVTVQEEYENIGLGLLNAGSSVQQLYFDVRLNLVLCVVAKKGFKDVECFYRPVSAETYSKLDVPFPIWRITFSQSKLVAADDLNGFPVQKCFVLCLATGKRSLGEIGVIDRPTNGRRVWVSRFLPSACESEEALCVYAQELVTSASGVGVVEYSIGRLNLSSFLIAKVARLATPFV